jgi:tRNA1Val (adenine37-N6)-methyltransferase
VNSWFEFKRFTVNQSGAAMKVGTDGVLLGAWARVEPSQRRLLDVGTGTGLIALMLAQRTEEWEAVIDAVEIDEGSFRQAAENFAASPWSAKLHAQHVPIDNYAPNAQSEGVVYDHIISTPPYFVDSLKAPEERRAAARHADSLPYEVLAARSAALLTTDGLLSIIIPADGESRFCMAADRCGLYVSRRTVVKSLPTAPPKRVMLEFSPARPAAIEESELLIETSQGGNYSEEYRQLTKDFYLKF